MAPPQIVSDEGDLVFEKQGQDATGAPCWERWERGGAFTNILLPRILRRLLNPLREPTETNTIDLGTFSIVSPV